jgi:hypothetical protein
MVHRVDELLRLDSQGWDETKLNECFFDGDVADILNIPIGRAGTEDYLAWNYTKNGVFSVKSAYHLKMQLNKERAGRAGPSSTCDEHKGWFALWGAAVPGKAKIHVWRLIQNGLAVGDELHRRQIKAGVKCVVFNREESLQHRFWTCPHSVATWDLIRAHTGVEMESPAADIRNHRLLHGWILIGWGDWRKRS